MNAPRASAWVVLLVVAAGPWAFGGADPYWAATLAFGCLVPFAAACLATAFRRGADPLPGRVVAACVAVPAVGLLGLAPVPAELRALVVPGGSALVARVGGSPAGPLSLAPDATREALALAVAYVGAFLLLRGEARRPAGRAAVTAVLTVSGVLLAGLGLAQHLTQPDPEHRLIYWTVPLAEVGTPFGPYVNRNHFAGAMAILAAVAAGEALAARAEGRRGRATLFAAAAALETVALCATTSRGGIAGAAVATALVWASLGAGRRRRGLFAIAAGAAGLAALLAWTGALGEIAHRFAHLEGRWMGRFQVQADAARVFLRNPWTGTGAGSFEQVFPAHQTVCDDRIFDNAHSDWAQFLMETGLLGILAAGLVVRAVLPWLRAGARAQGAARWRILGPLAGAAACAAHGFVDVGLHLPANALLTVSALSLASAAAAPAEEPARPEPTAASVAGETPLHGAA